MATITPVAELFQKHALLAEFLDTVAGVVRAVGTPKFEDRLMQFLSELVPVDHCAVFTYSETGETGHLFTHSQMPDHDAERLARSYVEKFHTADPNYQTIQEMENVGYHCFNRLDTRQDYDPAYKNHFFDRSGLIDKASSIGRVEDGSVYCNFYRMNSSTVYSDHEWRMLEDIMPLATGLVAKHYELARARGHIFLDNGSENIVRKSIVHNVISQDSSSFKGLTRRERQVCERILLGFSTIGIGLDLDIAPTSVATYRKRAYAKLEISSQNELFSLCLKAL